MSELLRFKTREAFREWLSENCRRREGVWLEFGKTKEVETLSANDALLEALCFGWIDGVMKKMDDTSYKKYFAPRRAGSKWSQKNKALVQELEACGAMTEYGRRKIEEAKKNGQWDNAASPSAISEEQIAAVAALLKENSLVCLQEEVPENTIEREDHWKAFRIQGILDFSLIGILSEISTLLAKNSIGIFAISTYNTDYILMKEEQFENAVRILAEAGYRIL